MSEPATGTAATAKRQRDSFWPRSALRLSAATAIIAALIASYWLLSKSGALEILGHSDLLRDHVARLGLYGPLAVIALMVVAIVIGPIPSAPIALAAGAVYGHTWGTLYVLVGSEAGALTAFGMARLLGCDLLPRVCASRESLRLLGSQNTLMGIVFVSRLLPFISFDVVSYAAGLTALSLWRFALATLAGVLPASFVLAHFGNELASAEMEKIALTVLALGLLTGVPIVARMVWLRFAGRSSKRKPLTAPGRHRRRTGA